jgi:hypothetical protein
MIQPKYMHNLEAGFLELPDEDQANTLTRMKEINGVDNDADISSNIAPYILQDMLFAIVDDVFKTQHVLTELCQSGIPESVIEANQITPEYEDAFKRGAAFATQVMQNLLVKSEVVEYFVHVVNTTDEEAELAEAVE